MKTVAGENRDNRGERDNGVILETPVISSSKQGVQKPYWCFTFNNYTTTDIETIEAIFKVECDWYLFQEEIGNVEKTPHLQGCVKFKGKGKRLTEVIKYNKDIHWEKTNKVSPSIIYACRADKRAPNGQLFYHNITLPEIAEPIELTEPYGWQLEVMDILKEKPHPRHIYWFWEETGNIGKTELCKYLAVKHQATIITGKTSDIFNAVLRAKSKKIFIVNIPKSLQDFVNYGAIEAVKDGLLYSGKYEGGQVVFNRPHIFVFSNQPPDRTKMSEDKFIVKYLGNTEFMDE